MPCSCNIDITQESGHQSCSYNIDTTKAVCISISHACMDWHLHNAKSIPDRHGKPPPCALLKGCTFQDYPTGPRDRSSGDTAAWLRGAGQHMESCIEVQVARGTTSACCPAITAEACLCTHVLRVDPVPCWDAASDNSDDIRRRARFYRPGACRRAQWHAHGLEDGIRLFS